MDTGYKSVAVDQETWEILQAWSNEEYRTVNGQIRWLVHKHLPPRLRKTEEQPIDKLKPRKKLRGNNTVSSIRSLAKDSQLFQIMNTISKMEEPLTNFELADLLDGELSLKQCVKRTSYAWSMKLLARQPNSEDSQGRYMYRLTNAGKKHLNRAT